MQCVKTTLKMFLPDIILHICDQTRWHDCNHKKCGTAELFSLHMLPNPYVLTCNVSRIHKKYFTCNASRWHRELWKYVSTCNLSRPQGEEPQHVGASSCFLFSIRGEPLRFCQFNDWKHKTFAHHDLGAKSAWFRDRVISCVTLNAFSTFPSSVFSTLPILCKTPWTVLALHLEVRQNMSSLVVCLCYHRQVI